MPDRSIPAEQAVMLLQRAREARRNAYVPYSHFTVGAALLTESGDIITGCNVENASYGLANCAERTAVFKAVSDGIRGFRAIAVVGLEDDAPCAPCGACRQVMYEFAPDLVVITPGADGTPEQRTMRQLLPDAFDPSALPALGGAR